MAGPLDRLIKGLLQQNRCSPTSFSPKRSTTIHHPFPKRFDYRIELLRERYLVSIHAIENEDTIHEFMYMPPVTPPNKVKGASPALSVDVPKQPSDFLPNEPIQDIVVIEPA